jgi:large subunit ribosomal protein L4
MPVVELKDRNNNIIGKINLKDEVFGLQAKPAVLHEVVTNYLANQRQGTHATKTKGLVRGGGRKPFKQKHTGRARAGSNRSPLWKGGGTIFGPQPRDYSYNLPKKVKRIAVKTALSMKVSEGAITVIDGFLLNQPKTKDMVMTLKNLGLEGKKVLIIIPEKDEVIILSARNIPDVRVVRVSDLNLYDVIVSNRLLMTKDAISRLGAAEVIA